MLPMPEVMLWLCVDFNFPFIKWPDNYVSGGTAEKQTQVKHHLDIMDNLFITQVIKKLTSQKNILDLLWTNEKEDVLDCWVEESMLPACNLIIVNTAYRKNLIKYPKIIPLNSLFVSLNFISYNTDWGTVQDSIKAGDWKQVMGNADPDTMLQALNNKLLGMCRASILEKRTQWNSKQHNIPRDTRILMRKGTSLNKQLKNIENEGRMQAIRSKVMDIEQKIMISHSQQRTENKAMGNIKRNPKCILTYCSRFSKIAIWPLQTTENTTTDPKMIPQLVLHQYNSVFSSPHVPGSQQ